MRCFAIALLALLFTGCDLVEPPRLPESTGSATVAGVFVPPPARPVTSDVTSEDLRNRLSEVEAARIALEGEAATLKKQIKQKEKEEAEAEQHRQQVFLYWFSGLALLLGVIAFGLSFAFISTPMLPVILRWGGTALFGIGALCLVAAWLLPYLFWIGAALALGLIGWVVWHARKSDKATGQLATAVNAIKGKVPDFKDVFRQHIDTDVDKHLDAVRSRFGI